MIYNQRPYAPVVSLVFVTEHSSNIASTEHRHCYFSKSYNHKLLLWHDLGFTNQFLTAR